MIINLAVHLGSVSNRTTHTILTCERQHPLNMSMSTLNRSEKGQIQTLEVSG